MNFGTNVAKARKQKGISQEQLAKAVGLIAVTIGRYERNEIKPSIDTAKKIADTLDVSLDYLTGGSDVALEKKMIDRIADIQKLTEKQRTVVITLLDAFLNQTKIEKMMAS